MKFDPGFAERVQHFGKRVAEWRVRVDDLRGNAPAALEALETAHEELNVAQEELRQQNEELLTAQIMLEQERERYRDLFEFAPDPYLITDPRGVIQEANRAAGRLLSIQPRYLVGRSFFHFIQAEDRPGARREVEHMQQTHAAVKFAAHVMPRNSAPVAAICTISALTQHSDLGERLTGIRWLVREPFHSNGEAADPTGFARTLEEQHQRVARLRKAVARERLARRRAQEAVHAKDQFLALICHELRNPLTPILLGIDGLLGREDLPPDVHEMLGMIHRNALAQRRLVDDLLDISRITHGKLDLRRETVPLHALLDQVIETARPALAAKELSLYFDYAPGDVSVFGDPVRLQQIFWNLLHNATKFTPAHGKIYVRTFLPEEGEQVIVEIQDTGTGIVSRDLATIFNAFEQSNATQAKHQGGLGLGLAIVQSLVKAHGGSIEAQSDGLGRGATFTVRLPRRSSRVPDDAQQRRASTGQMPLVICIVDDHLDTLTAMTKLLTSFGHHVRTAVSIEQARQLLEEQPCDLLLCDLNLPDGTGLDLLDGRIRDRCRRAVAISGLRDPQVLSRAREVGFADVLAKPLSMDELLRVLTIGQLG